MSDDNTEIETLNKSLADETNKNKKSLTKNIGPYLLGILSITQEKHLAKELSEKSN